MLNEQTMTKLYAMKLNGMADGYEEQRQQPQDGRPVVRRTLRACWWTASGAGAKNAR